MTKTQDLMKQVYDKGFNIYSALNHTKKKLNMREDFPSDVIDKVCQCYLDKPPGNVPKMQYAWFTVSLKEASRDWFATKEQERHAEYKKQFNPQSLKEIMRSV